MRVFKNKDTHQIIIVSNDHAYSIYGYENDDPVSIARELLDSSTPSTHLRNPCIKIEIPTTEEIQPNEIDDRVMIARLKQTKEVKEFNERCGHSQTRNKSKSSTNSILNSPSTTSKIASSKTAQKLLPDGNQLEMSQ